MVVQNLGVVLQIPKLEAGLVLLPSVNSDVLISEKLVFISTTLVSSNFLLIFLF